MCSTCEDKGIEYSGVCHCGAEMDGHSVYDNHGATEMWRYCPDCAAGIMLELVNAIYEEQSKKEESFFTSN
jgi:hypothetical protein